MEHPLCLKVQEDFLGEEHTLAANLTVLHHTFLGAAKLGLSEERLLLMDNFPDASFTNTQDGQLRMETEAGLRYWSDHGQYKCKQWVITVGFGPC